MSAQQSGRESFQLAFAVRKLLPVLPEWNRSEGDGSLSVCFDPVREEIRRVFDVEIKAEFWVAREKRVSFAFWSGSAKARSPKFQVLKEKLAEDFRDFLWSRDVPKPCRKSKGATVLRVPVKELDEESAKRVVEAFTFIRNNIDQWRGERLTLLLDDTQSRRDVLDDVRRTQESAIEGLKTEVKQFRTKRSRKLRDGAFEAASGICCVCDRDFSKMLGGAGVRVLQVHHRDQLAARKAPSITKQRDLAVVCANCHLLLHLDSEKALSVEELRKMLRADGFYD